MEYVVIENWENLDSPQLCTDENGATIVFETLADAEEEAEGCHDGIVVPLTDIISLIRDASAFVDVVRFEEGEDVDEDDLESRLNECLE